MDNIISKYKLEKIKDLTWKDVFQVWRENEDFEGSHWIELWQSRGFKSWEEWRITYAKKLGLADLNWALYRILKPMDDVPEFCGGSFRSWVERFYQGQENPSFSWLAKQPDIQAHQGIQKFITSFPENTTVSGILIKDKIVIVEGMHRCTAIALAEVLNEKIILNNMYICIAEYDQDQMPVVGKNVND